MTPTSLRNLELSTSEESKPPSGDGHDNARSATPEVPHVMEEKLNVTEPSTSPPINWNVEMQDAPESKSFFLLCLFNSLYTLDSSSNS